MNLTRRQLEAFLHLVDLGSFTLAAEALADTWTYETMLKAAEACHVSQPTLSRTIQTIEEVVGASLFERDSRHIVLSPTGLGVCPIARRLLHEMDNAALELARVVRGQHGRLTVAALPSVAGVLLPPVIARFHMSHPDVDVFIDDGLSASVLSCVADGRADAGITVRPLPERRLRYRQVLTDRFCVLHRAGDPPAGEGTVGWPIFTTRPFIAMSPESSVRPMTDAAFLTAGLSVAPLYECGHLATGGGLVAAGLGLTALPELAIAALGNPSLATTRLEGPVLDRSIGVVTRAGRQPPAFLEAFLGVLQAEAGDILARFRTG